MNRGPADELRYVGRTLDDAATATADVVARLAEVWADAAGREWADRLWRVGRALDDLATDAFERADREARAEEPAGIVLGAQTGARTTDRRGVVAPTLPAPP